MVELSVTATVRAPLAQELTRGREALDAVVKGVGYVDCAVGSHRHASRPVELPVAVAPTTPLDHQTAIGGEALHAVVQVIRHVDCAVRGHCHANRQVELPRWRLGTDGEEEFVGQGL